MIDLHVHTTASDGQYSPSQIIQMAAEKAFKAIAITDHDTIAGIPEAKIAAEKYNITLVPGTELNINTKRGEFHLLGLGLQKESPSLKKILEELQGNRLLRNQEIISKMQNAGIDISLEEIQNHFPNTEIGRPHLAKMLVLKKIVKNNQQAFDKYLGQGRPFFVQRVGANLDEAIIAIRESGGLPVLAHPMSLYISWGKLPDVLQDYFERGIAGLEAYHPGAKMGDCIRLEELGKKIGYFITAASDFHGEKIRADRKLGHTVGNKKIDDRFYFEELLPALKSQEIL